MTVERHNSATKIRHQSINTCGAAANSTDSNAQRNHVCRYASATIAQCISTSSKHQLSRLFGPKKREVEEAGETMPDSQNLDCQANWISENKYKWHWYELLVCLARLLHASKDQLNYPCLSVSQLRQKSMILSSMRWIFADNAPAIDAAHRIELQPGNLSALNPRRVAPTQQQPGRERKRTRRCRTGILAATDDLEQPRA